MSGMGSHELWGISVAAGHAKKVILKDTDLLHISQVSFSNETTERSIATITIDEAKYVLCTLSKQSETWSMDVSLYGPRDVLFACSTGSVDLFGYRMTNAAGEGTVSAPKIVEVSSKDAKAPAAKRAAPDSTAVAEPAQKQQQTKKQKVEEVKPKEQQPQKQDKSKAATPEKQPQKDAKKEGANKEGDKKEAAKKDGGNKKDSKEDKPQAKVLQGGLKVVDSVVGKGKEATAGKRVTVHYTGKLAKTQKKFDSSVGRAPFTFRLGAREVIAGWDIGVAGMREGGKRKLHIPSKLGYGLEGAGKDIPPGADLEFDVELLKIQ